MKKLLFGLSLFAITSLALTSCKKDKKADCVSTVEAYTDAMKAYSSEQNTANCKALKSALQNYLNSDCMNSVSADQKAIFQEMANSLTCN